MKRNLLISFFSVLVVTLFALSACAPAATPAPTQAPADQPTETPAPQPPQVQASPTAPGGKLVSNNGVEFTVPVGLGADTASSIVPEVLAPEPVPGGNPAYLQFKLQGYPLPGTQYLYAQVQVYDAKAYAADFAVGSLNSKALKALLAAPDMQLTWDVMPPSYLLMASNMKLVSSADVRGVRMLSVHGNGSLLVTNDDLSYQFHGLTTDGKFYVIVDLPVTAPFLQAHFDAPVPAGGVAVPQDGTGIPAYMAQVSKLLNEAETAGALSPSITLMDTLVQSLKLNSAGIVLPTPQPTPTTQPTLAEQLTQTATPTVNVSQLPVPPSGLTYSYDCSSGDLQITLTWDDVANNEDGYRVYRDHVLVQELPAGTTIYVDTVPRGTGEYAYSVVAFNFAGESYPVRIVANTPHCQ